MEIRHAPLEPQRRLFPLPVLQLQRGPHTHREGEEGQHGHIDGPLHLLSSKCYDSQNGNRNQPVRIISQEGEVDGDLLPEIVSDAVQRLREQRSVVQPALRQLLQTAAVVERVEGQQRVLGVRDIGRRLQPTPTPLSVGFGDAHRQLDSVHVPKNAVVAVAVVVQSVDARFVNLFFGVWLLVRCIVPSPVIVLDVRVFWVFCAERKFHTQLLAHFYGVGRVQQELVLLSVRLLFESGFAGSEQAEHLSAAHVLVAASLQAGVLQTRQHSCSALCEEGALVDLLGAAVASFGDGELLLRVAHFEDHTHVEEVVLAIVHDIFCGILLSGTSRLRYDFFVVVIARYIKFRNLLFWRLAQLGHLGKSIPCRVRVFFKLLERG
mmetsp:Transcript_7357/g.13947  ORF Transcript_7357/g.13947 Transcript_7357/m.13947 type:complete len:378 (-) Transcript_7357:63-1196(-)